MKKYFTVFIILFLILIPLVNAEEYNSCFDQYKIADSVSFTSTSNYHSRMLVNLPLDNDHSKVYYLKLWNLDHSHNYTVGSLHHYYDAEGKILAKYTNSYSSVSELNSNDTIIYSSQGSLEGLSYFNLSFYVYEVNNYYKPNSDVILTLSDYELTECPVIDEPVVPDSTLDNFYSIYLDKLKLLSDYVLENKFFFSAIGIILLFIVLEFILHLFFINRRR